MLILIAGITGNLGKHLAVAALEAGHTVRGLARSTKLPETTSSKLESFVQSKSYDDIAALDKACTGVDAIIVAYAPYPEPSLEGQLLLLRAAERAGIKRFHAASWNLNWSQQPLGTLETYDPYISFMHQARLTSSIKPLYVFCGALAQTFFAVPGAGALEGEKALWQRLEDGKRKVNVVGTGDEKHDVTTEANAAAFSVALVASDKAEAGGFYSVRSDAFTLKDLKAMYEKVKGKEVVWNETGLTIPVVEGIITQARGAALAQGNLNEAWHHYIGLVYVKYMINGEMGLDKLATDLFPEVKWTTLEDYVTNSPDI